LNSIPKRCVAADLAGIGLCHLVANIQMVTASGVPASPPSSFAWQRG
jgi:hypothetical protein